MTKKQSTTAAGRGLKASKQLLEQVRNLVLAAAEQDDALKQVTGLLKTEFKAGCAAALLFNDHDRTFHIAEEAGPAAKRRRRLKAVVPSVTDFANSESFPAKSYGLVLMPAADESKKSGVNSTLVYYLVRSGRLISALVFCSEKEPFDESAVKTLDGTAALIAVLAENRSYRDREARNAEFVNLDGLTGLYNRRHFEDNLANELLKSERFDYEVSLLIIDVDHFKRINDKYGHPRGDTTLREISRIIREMIRAYDVPARYGGEEFALILPHADLDHAVEVAERIRKAIMDHPFHGRNARERLHVTVSIGAATYPDNARTKAELIDRADQALYLAKSEGRNKVCRSLARSSNSIKIGFCPAARTSPYYSDILDGMQDVVKEIKRIELSVRAPERESDYHELETLFLRFVRDKPDAVAVCTQSPNAVRDLQILHQANIPVFFFNVPQKISDRRIRTYVGYDQSEAGKTVAEFLARLLRKRGNIAVLEGLPEPTNRLRLAGFRRELKSFPEIHIAASERADWSSVRARKATARLLRKHTDLDAIFAVNDEMALGAVEAVKAEGLLGRIFIVGLDGTKEALESIRDGGLTATLNTSPREMGRLLLRTIVRGLIKEEKVARQIFSPASIVTVENVEHALNP